MYCRSAIKGTIALREEYRNSPIFSPEFHRRWKPVWGSESNEQLDVALRSTLPLGVPKRGVLQRTPERFLRECFPEI